MNIVMFGMLLSVIVPVSASMVHDDRMHYYDIASEATNSFLELTLISEVNSKHIWYPRNGDKHIIALRYLLYKTQFPWLLICNQKFICDEGNGRYGRFARNIFRPRILVGELKKNWISATNCFNFPFGLSQVINTSYFCGGFNWKMPLIRYEMDSGNFLLGETLPMPWVICTSAINYDKIVYLHDMGGGDLTHTLSPQAEHANVLSFRRDMEQELIGWKKNIYECSLLLPVEDCWTNLLGKDIFALANLPPSWRTADCVMECDYVPHSSLFTGKNPVSFRLYKFTSGDGYIFTYKTVNSNEIIYRVTLRWKRYVNEMALGGHEKITPMRKWMRWGDGIAALGMKSDFCVLAEKNGTFNSRFKVGDGEMQTPVTSVSWIAQLGHIAPSTFSTNLMDMVLCKNIEQDLVHEMFRLPLQE